MMFSGAWTSRPSIEKVTHFSSGRGMVLRHRSLDERQLGLGLDGRGPALLPAHLDVLLELLAELLDHRADRHRHRVAEDAQAVADDLRLDRGHDVEVHRRGLAGVDALEHLHGPVRALAARRAFAAELVAVELRDP